ncbi:MAG: DUF5667 domain-containing protein [Anaerolineales bacterium]
MTKQTPDLKIEERLEELKAVPSRNVGQAARGRANFLSEGAKYQQAVSPDTKVRQSGWIFLINRKEKFAMNALISLMLATALILGGGATAVAAQDDLPDQPLYPVKLWTENATLSMTGDPQLKANLLMQMSQTRVEEMTGLVDNGIPVPDQVQDRLQDQIQQTLMLAADMDDVALTQTLLQLRDQLQTQDRIMEQLQTHASLDTEPLLTQTRSMLQTRLQLVDEGLADPQGFRYAMANQMGYGQDEGVTPEPNQQGEPGFHQNEQGGQTVDPSGIGAGNGASNGQNPDNSQKGNGGQNQGSPQNGNGSGSGGTSDNSSPENLQDGSGSGSGNGGGGGSGGNK